ncbi:MAG: DUF481 domain-containing protein, partial [candidate division Zixibacteria bacterium]|nr:DUF481 domain-containing protein [candidate division Zixibacteria bacterium]NIR66912.1 DUF481 domain-containing protein [candidate division Zixibacteria bacterium]NIS48368.1 DUF481 domain-containing protein [candidate division Zixibacteria bacterium]NIU16490.1 DUF481 domain-containing protein [candidate division Zixibacteria bacterium]NIV08611.1 DUF481 domain-containing protein [candidate division Zixibacteria bacterium]
GLGFDVVKTERQHLKTLLSAVYYDDDYTGDGPDQDEYWAAKASLRYRWDITKTTTFKEAI